MSDDPPPGVPGGTEARTEVRAAGICCPSCGKNTASLTGTEHELKFSDSPAAEGSTAQCADGAPVDLAAADFGTFQSLANVQLLDAYNRNWDEAMREMLPRGFLP